MQAFALAVPHAEALRIQDDVAFFQAVQAVLAKRAPGDARPEDQPLRVTDEHLTAALDQLLDTSNELTRLLLGSQAPHTPQHQPG